MQLALTIFLPEVLRAIAGFRISLVVLFAWKRKLLSSDFSLVISAVPSLFWPFEEGQRQRDYGDLGGFVQGAARRKHLPCSDHSRPLRRGIGLHADAQGGAGARDHYFHKNLCLPSSSRLSSGNCPGLHNSDSCTHLLNQKEKAQKNLTFFWDK